MDRAASIVLCSMWYVECTRRNMNFVISLHQCIVVGWRFLPIFDCFCCFGVCILCLVVGYHPPLFAEWLYVFLLCVYQRTHVFSALSASFVDLHCSWIRAVTASTGCCFDWMDRHSVPDSFRLLCYVHCACCTELTDLFVLCIVYFLPPLIHLRQPY